MSKPQLAVNFAALLRSLRQKALLTQEDLAARSGVSVGTIAGLENGRTRRPRAGSLRLLADALDLTDAGRAELVAAAGPPDPGRVPTGDLPTHLPPTLAAFVGRVGDLDRLDRALRDDTPATTTIVTISGTAGVGKTTLAMRWAHRVADRFPDGHLHLNLRGFDETGEPMRSDEAVRHLLAALSPADDTPPTGYAAQLAAYHRIAAERRLLIVLDNAHDADQVAPLLPGSPGSHVVITSRNQMSGLVATYGAYPVELDVLSADEARDLLAVRVGRARVAAEPDAVDEIIARCARLPLALSVLAARAATYPDFPLAALAGQLRDAARLDVLNGGDAGTDIRAVFTWSYRTLSPAAAQLFRLLGANSGAEFGAPAAASLLGRPLAATRPLLAELVRAHLLTESHAGRYTCHDLLRAFAAEEAAAGDPDAGRAATFRLLDYYLQSAHVASRLIEACQNPIEPGPPAPDVTVERPLDRDAALGWLGVERDTLVATVRWAAAHGYDTHTWQLAWAIKMYFDWRGQTEDWVDTQYLALAATERLDDTEARARVHRALAIALVRMGRPEEALIHIQRALDLFIELGDLGSQARTHHNVAYVLNQLDRYPEAIPHAQRTVELHDLLGDDRGASMALNLVGWCLVHTGDDEGALAYCEQALDRLPPGDEENDNRANTLDSIGFIRLRLGDFAGAADSYQQAADLAGPSGDRYLYALISVGLGDARLAAGEPDAAREAWQVALATYEDLHDPRADDVRDKIKKL